MNDADSDDRQAPGTARAAKTVKAGCGIRFDPETLNEDVGFDFSGASRLFEKNEEADVEADTEAEEKRPAGKEKGAAP